MAKDTDWVLLTILSNVPDAHILGSALEDAQVACLVQGQQNVGVFGHTGGLVRMKVMVDRAHEEKARRVLADFEAARSDPDSVHFLCNVDSAGQELRDLDNLVLDLERLTLCSVGRDQGRDAILAQLGDPELDPDAPNVLRYPELGAVLTLDESSRLQRFTVRVSGDTDDDLEEFPGFWDPGSTLRPPTFDRLKELFGEPTEWQESDGFLYRWERDGRRVQADFSARGQLLRFGVSFGPQPA